MSVKVSKKCKRSVKSFKKSPNCMFFTVVMRKNQIYTSWVLLTIAVMACFLSCTKTENEATEQSIKVALRDVGHNLLLANQDSTSLVLPITRLTESTYKLSFASKLEIEPSNLVSQVKASFEKANLANHYITEVLECHNPERYCGLGSVEVLCKRFIRQLGRF